MKQLDNHLKEVNFLRKQLLNEIRMFFNSEPNTQINVAETEGVDIELINGMLVTTIMEDGVHDLHKDGDVVPFGELASEDLSDIIDVINNYLVDLAKIIKRASN